MLCSCVLQAQVPHFNAPIYLSNKSAIGKVDEILGPINEVFFSVKMNDGCVASSFKQGDKVFGAPEKVLPLERFLPKPKVIGGVTKRGRGGAGRGGRGGSRGGPPRGRGFGPPRGGRGGFASRGRGDRGGFGRGTCLSPFLMLKQQIDGIRWWRWWLRRRAWEGRLPWIMMANYEWLYNTLYIV